MLVIAIALSFILSIFFGYMYVYTELLPYNSEGNYFDEKDCVVYHAQTIVVWLILAVVSLLVTAVLFAIKWSFRREV